MTPKVLANVKETIEDNLDWLDGYDEIPPEMQDKVKRALDQGHVDDEEWNGVSEYDWIWGIILVDVSLGCRVQ